jgi:hypothetical protein
MNDRFKTLNGIGKFISAVGWVGVVAAVIVGIIMLGKSPLIGQLVLFAGIMLSLVEVAQGQMIQCFVAIEHNTRATVKQTNASEVPTSKPTVNSEQALETANSAQALEKVLEDWDMRPDLPLDMGEKNRLRELLPAMRDNLTVAQWLAIARLLKNDPNADLSKWKKV